MEPGGAYTADRAAALSGVPWSTVHYWARRGFLPPSVSAERVKLWSYSDLLGLRFLYWLRHAKRAWEGFDIPATSMGAVRRALDSLKTLDLDLFESGRPTIKVDRAGRVHIAAPDARPQTPHGQIVSDEIIDLIAPFDTLEGARAPDLSEPSSYVRIVPRKLSGAPHVINSRVETLALHALDERGFPLDKITRLYPALRREAIDDAIRLERQLAKNRKRAA